MKILLEVRDNAAQDRLYDALKTTLAQPNAEIYRLNDNSGYPLTGVFVVISTQGD